MLLHVLRRLFVVGLLVAGVLHAPFVSASGCTGLLCVLGGGVLQPPTTSTTCIPSGGVLSVTSCGATPADADIDTGHIQNAINAVANAGGGTVTFPSGHYDAKGLILRSNVELRGLAPDARLEQMEGATSLVTSEILAVDAVADIAAGASTITGLSDTSAFNVGDPIAIRGAAGGSDVQRAELAMGAPFGWSSLKLADVTGFPNGMTNYLTIDDEIVRYSGMMGGFLKGVARGQLGTTVEPHSQGAVVRQLQHLYGVVLSKTSTSLTIDQPARFGVSNTTLYRGSRNMTVTDLTIVGNRPESGNPQYPLMFGLARSVAIRGCDISNGKQGAVSLERGTSNSTVEGNTLTGNGDPANNMGSHVWLFQHTHDNVVRNNLIADGGANGASFAGVTIDDRTVTASEWDGDSAANVVQGNTIHISRIYPTPYYAAPGNPAILISGSTGNQVLSNTVSGPEGGEATFYGVWVIDIQGQFPRASTGNVIDGNVFAANDVGIRSNSSLNAYTLDQVRSATQVPCIDDGSGNDFTGSTADGDQLICVPSP